MSEPSGRTQDEHRFALAAAATSWIERTATFRFLVGWDSRDRKDVPSGGTVPAKLDHLRLMIAARDLRSELARELAAALCSPLGVYQCDECGNPYTPLKRKPWASGRRRSLCLVCRGSLEVKAERQRLRYWKGHSTPRRSSKYRTREGRPR